MASLFVFRPTAAASVLRRSASRLSSAQLMLQGFAATKCSAHCHDDSDVHETVDCANGAVGTNGLTPAQPVLVSRRLATQSPASQAREYAFEFTASTMRFGSGVTRECGMDLKTWGVKKTLVVTDPVMVNLPPYKAVIESLVHNGCEHDTFDRVRVEPSDVSFNEAIDYARSGGFDSFVAVGGGSSMDTAKAASIFAANPGTELLDYVGPPFGKSLLPKNKLLPLICVPTTAGTGSETTAIAVFDLLEHNSKFGIRTRALKPTLGLVDPDHQRWMPRHVAIYSGFDVLCHSLESYTNIPYQMRPASASPASRPLYQGSNPLSDVWCREALRIMNKYFYRSVNDAEDTEARTAMIKASAFAGMGFGNAGVHLCHGLSYAMSSAVKKYVSPDYPEGKPLIPHGLSVILTAPADFELTGSTSPDRHLEAASLLGVDTSTARQADAGRVLGDVVRRYMQELGVPNGLGAVGFGEADIPQLAVDALPTTLSSQVAPVRVESTEVIEGLYKKSMKVY